MCRLHTKRMRTRLCFCSDALSDYSTMYVYTVHHVDFAIHHVDSQVTIQLMNVFEQFFKTDLPAIGDDSDIVRSICMVEIEKVSVIEELFCILLLIYISNEIFDETHSIESKPSGNCVQWNFDLWINKNVRPNRQIRCLIYIFFLFYKKSMIRDDLIRTTKS